MPSGKDADFLEFVLDQLSRIPAVTSRRMFGGIGLYQGPVFFAIIDDGRLYFVTDDETRACYVSRRMGPFEYTPGKFIRTYYEVPIDVLENDTELQEWAREAVAAQKRRGTKKTRTKRTAPRKKRGQK